MPAPALLSEPAMVSAIGMLVLEVRCLFWRATATVVDPFKWRADRLPYNLKEKSALRSAFATEENLAVVADGFDRATFHRFFAARFFLRILCLFVNVGMSTVIVALEICRRGFTAQIAVDTLVVD